MAGKEVRRPKQRQKLKRKGMPEGLAKRIANRPRKGK